MFLWLVQLAPQVQVQCDQNRDRRYRFSFNSTNDHTDTELCLGLTGSVQRHIWFLTFSI